MSDILLKTVFRSYSSLCSGMPCDNWGLHLSYCFYQRLVITLVSDPYRVDLRSGWTLIFSHRPILPLELEVFNLHGYIHNSPTPELGASHVNLSMEVRDYRPWRLGEISAPYLHDQWMSGKMSFSKINPILSLGSVEPNINGQAKNGRLKVDSA